MFQQDVLRFHEKTGTLLAGAAANVGIPTRQRSQVSTDLAVSVDDRRINRCCRMLLYLQNFLQVEIR